MEILREERTKEVSSERNTEGEKTSLEEKNKDHLKINCMDDLSKLAGTNGRWNFTIYILCAISSCMFALQVVTYQFTGGTPHYWCHVDELVTANWTQQQILDIAIPFKNGSNGGRDGCVLYDYNYTELAQMGYRSARTFLSDGHPPTVPCTSRTFNRTQYNSTVVTEWDLVCERRVLYSTTQAASQIGTMCGEIISGCLMDVLGRRYVVLGCVLMALTSGTVASLSPILEVFIVLKIIVTAATKGAYNGCFVITMELCSPKQRSLVGSFFLVPWALAYMVAPGIAYLVKGWRWLQAAYTMPVALLFVYFWILPEPPRWLVLKGRYQEAHNVLAQAAKYNGRQLPPPHMLMAAMDDIRKKESPKVKREDEEGSIISHLAPKISDVLVLVTSPGYRVITFVSFFCWFSASAVYYGVSLNSTNLSTDPYLYVFLGGVVEVPSYVLLWLAIVYFGRRISLITCFITCSISIAVVAVLLVLHLEVSPALVIALSLSGKMAVTAAFHLEYLYTAELYPTKYRSLAIGLLGMVARFGSITSPYINDILGGWITWAPSALFAGLSVTAAALALLLPETKDINLPDDINSRQIIKEDIHPKVVCQEDHS